MTVRTVMYARRSFAFTLALGTALFAAPAAAAFEGAADKEADRFDTGRGSLEIAFLGHASLALEYQGNKIYIDPVRRYADFSKYPNADLLLITHEHGDHLESAAIDALKGSATRIVLPESSRAKLGEGETLDHGKTVEAAGIAALAVPAYNVSADRLRYHPKERKDNGYILTVGNLRIYVAGDTEPIPEMADFGRIDIAFLPMNLPFTMTPEQAAAAARTIKPRILYPYHFGTTDPNLLVKLLADEKGIEVRVRNLQ